MLVLHAAGCTMPALYPSFRCSVPWLLLLLQTLLLIGFFFGFPPAGDIYSPANFHPGKPGSLLGMIPAPVVP